jgi:chromosome partitioning protein
MIFTVINTKGGVGKTTTAIHLATMLARNFDTLLIDTDPQQSAAAWAAIRNDEILHTLGPSPTTTCLYGAAIRTEGVKISYKYDHVVVDAGGQDAIGIRASLIMANRVIIPIGASFLDSCALTDLMAVVELSCEIKPELKVSVLLSRVDNRSNDTKKMRLFLMEQGLHVLESEISERVAFRRSIADGVIVQELGKDASAIAEVETFFNEVTA